MSDTRTVAVKLRADTTSYTSSMKGAAASTAKFDAAQEKAQRRADKWRAIGMAGQVGGVAMAAGLLAATKAASNQEQALGSLTAVFKANGAAMTANAKQATQIGLSTTDYANAAAKLGAQLSNLGVDQANLGGTTDDLIRKASDLAAQFGGTTQEAVDALGAAMRGEADPAERYGLALNATAVNAEMAATGADKATAMMSLLNKQMEKSGTVGAWNREMNTAASQAQMARAEFDNAAAALGETLLPAMAGGAGTAKDLLAAFNGLPDPLKNTITYVGVFVSAFAIAGPKIIGAITLMQSALSRLGQHMSAVADPFSGTNAGGKWTQYATRIAAVGTAAALAIPIVKELFDTTTEWTVGTVTSDLDLMTQQLLAFSRDGSTGIGRFGDELMGLGDAFAQNASVFDQWVRMGPFNSALNSAEGEIQSLDQTLAAMVGSGNADAAAAAIERMKQQTIAAGGSAEDVTGALPKYSDAVEAARLAADNAATATTSDAEAKENQAEAVKKATEAYEAYITAVQTALGLLSAKDAMIGQEERLADAVKKNGTALKGQTKEAAANRAAIAGEVENIANLVQAKYDETGSLEAAERVRKKQIDNLRASAEAAGYSRKETAALLRKLDLIHPIRTGVTVDGLPEATAQAQALARALGKIVKNSGLGNFGIGMPRAVGGYISGPGTGTSDSIPANLSNGEYVLRASAVKRIGVDELDRMNYAKGGRVGRRKPSGGGRSPARGGGSGPGRAHAGGGGSDMGFGQAVKAIERWQDKVEKSKQKLADLKRESADYANTITQGILASSGGGLFDMFKKSDIEANAKKAADAADNVAAATRRLYDAQVKANEAAPEERAAALKELADAQRDLATATGEQAQAQAAADASAPTADNILGKMKGRAAAIENYASKVKALMGRGLSIELIKELAGSDMMEAGPVLDALLAMPADALAELGSLDKRAKDAAASVGSAVSGAAFAPQMAQAETELSVNTDGLDDALEDADKEFLTKKWRKVLAKAGLSAEERVQLMQSLRANDGKLTKHWRSVLAKAGLSAEERAELMEALGGADTTMGREWRDKLQKTGLSAEEKADLAAELANAKNPERALRKYWLDELQETGLSAKESASLYDEIANTKKPGRKLRAEWIDQLQETGLSAKEAADMVAKIQATNKKVDDDFNNRTNEAKLKAAKDAGFDTTVTGAATAANSVSGDKVAKLYANKVGDPEGNAKSVKDAADAVNGDYTAKLKSEKVDTPVERAQETGTKIAEALVKDFTGKLKSEKVGQPIENAVTTGTEIGNAIARDFTAKLKLNPGTVVSDANKIGAALGAALMAGINKGKKKPRTRQFSSTAEDEEMTADTTIGVAADDSIHTETDGAMRFVERKWSDNTFRAKLGIKVAGDFGADLQAIKNAVAWVLNTPPVTMQIATQTVTTSATGGLITGAGTATSDSIPALLSNGEYVVRAASVAKYGAGMLEAINTGRYASGGPVGYRTTTTANPSTSIGSAVVTSTVPVIVQIDGRAIAQSQLKVQRQSGGTITVGG